MKRETKLLIGLVIIAFIIRAIFLFSTPIKIWDETVYANLGYDLSRNPFDYSVQHNGWSDFIPSAGDNLYAWPKMGFRAPLLSYSLSIFYLLNLDFLVSLFIPIIGALSVALIFILGKKLFNEKIGLYSAIFLSFLPLHVVYSAKILADVLFTFFVLLTFISFWEGYEKNNKKYKILFGFFLALALLSKYTALWIIPIFLIYLFIKNKSLNFLKDKYLWYAVGAFFLILIPWFIYGIREYSNPLGAFIHGGKAAAYWGGSQSWHFFFDYWLQIFSVLGIIFIIALIYILYKKEYLKKEICLVLIWFALFLGMASYMPHKEDRYLLAIAPAMCLITGFFVDKIRKYKKILLSSIIIVLLISLSFQFVITYGKSYTDTNKCFLEANNFLQNKIGDILIVTDESPTVYYYTKKETHFYPNPWSLENLRNLVKNGYPDKENYFLFTDFSMPLGGDKYNKVKEDLDKNFEKVFECSKSKGYSAVYLISTNKE